MCIRGKMQFSDGCIQDFIISAKKEDEKTDLEILINELIDKKLKEISIKKDEGVYNANN